jgi:hypothetical protein
MVNDRKDLIIFDAMKTCYMKTESNIVLYCYNFIDQSCKTKY